MAIYKAEDLLQEFRVELRSWARAGIGDPRLVENEYLILHKTHASAIISAKTHVCLEDRYTQVKAPSQLGPPRGWERFQVEDPPKILYRNVHVGRGTMSLESQPWNIGTHHAYDGSAFGPVIVHTPGI
jgi:hypothetical protein